MSNHRYTCALLSSLAAFLTLAKPTVAQDCNNNGIPDAGDISCGTPGNPSEGFALDTTGFASLAFDSGHILILPEPATILPLLACMLIAGRRRK